jgi:hypothetical protein
VRREIARTTVSFGLDNAACGLPVDRTMDENFPDTLPRDGQYWLRIKLTRKFSEFLRCDSQT